MTLPSHLNAVARCAGILLCFCGSLCWADGACADSMTSTHYTCIYKTCSSSVDVDTPNSGDAQHYSCESVECCKQLFTNCYFDGGDCTQAQMRNAATRESVIQAAGDSKVLVADCRGHYVVYDPRQLRNPQLIDEHILR